MNDYMNTYRKYFIKFALGPKLFLTSMVMCKGHARSQKHSLTSPRRINQNFVSCDFLMLDGFFTVCQTHLQDHVAAAAACLSRVKFSCGRKFLAEPEQRHA